MGEYKLAPSIQETLYKGNRCFWVTAQNSNIDPTIDPLPLVNVRLKCRFRPIALEGLQKAGRAYEIVFVGGNLKRHTNRWELTLGISVLVRLSLSQRMVVLESEAGLPDLQSADLAIYSEKHRPSMVPRLTTFFSGIGCRMGKRFPTFCAP